MASPRGSYAKTPEVRLRIVEAATELFAASGYRGATMKDIAEAAGLTPKGLAHHFPSKDELLMAVLVRRDARGEEPYPIANSPFDVILAIIEQNRLQPHLIELHTVVSAEASAEDHPAHEHYRERYEQVRAGVAQVFQAVMDDAQRPSELSAEDLSTLLLAVIGGLQVQWLYNPDAVDMERLARAFLRAVISDEAEGLMHSPGAVT